MLCALYKVKFYNFKIEKVRVLIQKVLLGVNYDSYLILYCKLIKLKITITILTVENNKIKINSTLYFYNIYRVSILNLSLEYLMYDSIFL